MDIKDSYLHGTVGVVKSISVSADKLTYNLADVANTAKTLTLPLATQSANGLLSKTDKKKIDSLGANASGNNFWEDTIPVNEAMKLTLVGYVDFTLFIRNTLSKSLSVYHISGYGKMEGNTKRISIIQIYKDNTSGVIAPVDGEAAIIIRNTSTNNILYTSAVILKGSFTTSLVTSDISLDVITDLNIAASNTHIKNGVITINGTSITPLTQHQSLANYVTLNDALTISGVKTFSTLLKFTVAKGTAPFLVTSDTLVTNLNADLLDGKHLMDFLHISDGEQNAFDLNTASPHKITALSWDSASKEYITNRPDDTVGGTVITLPGSKGFQFYKPFGTNKLMFRGRYWNEWDSWKTVAFTDSDITGNAATATHASTADKLKTKRKLWGLDFDGTADVSGVIYGCTSIRDANNNWIVGKEDDNNGEVSLGSAAKRQPVAMRNGQGLIYLNSSGNVGIGTTNPAHKLDVNGTITGTKIYSRWFGGTNTTDGGLFGDASMIIGSNYTGAVIYSYGDAPIWFHTGRKLQMIFDSKGQLGLGINTPSEKIDVNGNVKATSFIGNLDGTYVNKLTGYQIATARGAVAATDSLNTALGKLEYKAYLGETAYDLVKGAYDGDGTIENLAEILKVLEGIKDTETIKAIIGKYLPLTGGKLNSGTDTPLVILGTDHSWIGFKNSSGTDLGWIGVLNSKLPSFYSDKSYKIWHEGNDGSGSGLDADLLDGYHESSFLRYRDLGSNGGATLWSQIGIRSYHRALPEGLSGIYNYGEVVSLPGSGSRLDIFTNHVGSSESGGLGGLWWRSGWNDDKKSWRRIIDSGNIASLSVNYATSAGNADSVDGQHFNWNNNKNDHTYLWAASSNGQAYLVHRASMSVNYASSAGNADTVDSCHKDDFLRRTDTLGYLGKFVLEDIPKGVTQVGSIGWTDYQNYPHAGGLWMTLRGTSSLRTALILFPSYSMSSPPILYSSINGGAWQGGYQLAYKSQIPTTMAWGSITGKPSTFTPSSHTHSYVTPYGEGSVANTRSANSDVAVCSGGWASASAGYGSTYGTTLDVSGYSTWYHRLAFRTDGRIEYWQGINTKTLTRYGTLAWTSDIPSYSTKSFSVNGTNYGIYTSASSLPTIYAPTSVGTDGYILQSNGYGTPYWTSRLSYSYPGVIWIGYIYRSSRSYTTWYASTLAGSATVTMYISSPSSSNNYHVALQSSTHTIIGGMCSIQAQFNAGKDGGQTTEGPLYAYSTVDVSKIEEAGPDVLVSSVYSGRFYIKAMRASDANNSSYYFDGLAFTGAGKDTNSLPLARINVILFGY